MTQRLNVHAKGQNAMKSLYSIGAYLSKSSVEKNLFHLIYFRVSQINGCAACLDMHSKDLLAEGESAQRLFLMDAWREAPFYSDRERAALAWAEAVTKLPGCQVPDAIYAEAIQQFSEEELIDLTMATIAINSYNRINLSFPAQVGTYQPGQYAVKSN